jgi:5-methylcytosine-specific restriction endonuclease McrA
LSARGTSNTNRRGSAFARRRRKTWLLAEFGDGISVTCPECSAVLFYSTLEVDLFPLPAARGGRYVRSNIRPICRPCNEDHGHRLQAELRAERLEKPRRRRRTRAGVTATCEAAP